MIKTLTLGNLILPVNIIQGPLAGVSTAPFRALTWQYGQPAFSCTEMISCHTIMNQPDYAYRRFIEKHQNEGKLCVQLSASNHEQLAEAVKRISDYDIDLIDLNCGCPVNKIRKKGAGSKLLTQPTEIYSLIRAMKNNTHLPVSIKIRVQGASDERFHADLANAINDADPDFLIVHGRHWTEDYDTACHYQDIAYFVQQIKKPVIGNGDIACVESLKKMFATGCAGVMIARAGVGQPWLIQKLIAEYQNEIFTLPSIQDIGRILIAHVEELAILLASETRAVLQARKLAKYYARSVTQKAAFCQALEHCSELVVLKRLVEQFFVAHNTPLY